MKRIKGNIFVLKVFGLAEQLLEIDEGHRVVDSNVVVCFMLGLLLGCLSPPSLLGNFAMMPSSEMGSIEGEHN